MNTANDELTAMAGWTDDDPAGDEHVRATGVLYAAATLEQLSLIELVERLNELNQNKLISIGAGEASNLLHEFWDQSYKRMSAKRRAALYARVFGAGAADADDRNEDFDDLFSTLVTALAQGSPETVAPAAAALRDNLAEHTDETTTAAATELRTTLAKIGAVLSDMELRTAYGRADDMWQVVERVMEEGGGGPDVQGPRTTATSGALILRHLPELCDDPPAEGELVDAAKAWVATSEAA